MKATACAIADVVLIEPKVFGDDRGFFYESFNQRAFAQATGVDVHFVQDNHSKSAKGVLRGLHYQVQNAQGKLVRVVAGEVFDVAVDIRPGSPTYGAWVGEILSAKNNRQLWIPAGLAHGFLVLSDSAEFFTKPPTTMHPSTSVVSPGTTPPWPLSGRTWVSRPSCRQKMPRVPRLEIRPGFPVRPEAWWRLRCEACWWTG